MKILFSSVSNPRYEALPDYLACALRRLGHDVVRFDHRRMIVPGRLRRRLPILERLDCDRMNRRFLRAVRDLRPDLVLVNQGSALRGETIEAAQRLGARCVNWFSDYPHEFNEGLAVAPAYDLFLHGASHAVRRHHDARQTGVGWLPFACAPEIHRPERRAGTGRPPRVVFVGSHYPERQVLLRHLHGLPVEIRGPGWERAAWDPHVNRMIRGAAMRPSAWRRLFTEAQIVVNIHYGAFGPLEVAGDLANTRVFEILACGALQIVDRQGDVLRLFREDEHVLAYSSGEELRDCVERALSDPSLRQAVAARGREEVLAHHTYEHRARCLTDPRFTGMVIPVKPESAARMAGGASA